MPLPILHSRHALSDADLVRLFHRTEAAWVGQLADGETLAVGTAYANGELARVWDANNVRDAALHDGLNPREAVTEVERHYAQRGARCWYWVMNPSADRERVGPLVAHLLACGYRETRDEIQYLRNATAAPARDVVGVKVIPARASFRHVRMLMEEKVAERWGGDEQFVAGQLRHLDDPHWDALLALEGNRPVAYLGVLPMGEIGRIEGVYVAPDFRRRGIGRMMMGRALEICARSLFKHVFLSVDPGNEAALALYRQMGFEKLGELVTYRAPPEAPLSS